MISKRLKSWLQYFQNFVEKPWYEIVLAFLAAIDAIVVIVPTDGLLISSALLAPRKWWRLWLWTAIGSTIGGIGFAFLVQAQGWEFLNQFFPSLEKSQGWLLAADLFSSYGLWLLFAFAMAPVVQQPMLALAALAHHSLAKIGIILLCGRLLKYFIMTVVARFAPEKIRKLWGVKDELDDVSS